MSDEPVQANGMGKMRDPVRLNLTDLHRFCRDVYTRMGLADEDAEFAARVIVAADVRGISTHGVRLLPRHIDAIRSGIIIPDARMTVLQETPTTLRIDAHHALGAAVGTRTMLALMAKAETVGSAFASVRNSTHFGIAGYFAAMALEKDMIGIAMTNANPVGVPTFGARGLFGTNPLAFAVPAGREAPFVLDMATTVITNGKIEAYGNRDEPLPSGWAVDAQSRPATESREVPTGLLTGRNFILPLGGAGEDHGGHKGFNLAVLVDILSAALAGGVSGPDVRHHGQPYPGSLVSHFFGAIKIASFRDPAEFRSDMDRMLRRLRECPPAPGHDRVYYAGLKEFEHAEECRRLGVPVETPVFEGLATLAEDLQVRRPALDMK